MNHRRELQEDVLGRGQRGCKGPEVGVCLACSRLAAESVAWWEGMGAHVLCGGEE